MARHIIIEGPDCAGKGFFIGQFLSYMKAPLNKPFDEADLETHDPDTFELLKELRWSVKSGAPNILDYTPEQAEKAIKDILAFRPMYQPLSIAVAEIPAATPENKEFARKIHAGELTQAEIANEYLQVIYDHHNYAKLLGMTHDIVLMDRSLPSYYAYQISSLGFPEMLNKWEQLHKIMTDEIDFIVIHLDAPTEVLAERKAKKKGVSVLDEIYFEKIEKIRDGYAECYARAYFPKTIRVDTSVTGDRPYDKFFEHLLIKLTNETAGLPTDN